MMDDDLARPLHSELDAVLDTMVDGVIMIDEAGLIQRYNPACSLIFGYNKDEVIGKDVSLLMPQPDKSRHGTYITNYQTTRKARIIGIGREVKGRRKDGSIFPMYLSVGEMPGENRHAFVGIIRDLSAETVQREKFDALQQEHFHLSRVAAMDQMGAAIAHEINQPLTAIMNYLEAGAILLGQNKFPNSGKLENILSQSALQAERAANILTRLRQFIETGHIEKKSEDLAQIIKSAADLTLPVYKTEHIDVDILLPAALPQVVVSDVQIQQVLVNLIRNACEAMQDSGEKTLTIEADIEGPDFVRVGVIDTGAGLTPDQFDKLYEPFSSSKKGGLGVGLSISQSIISNHDGRLWAEQKSPRGTGFYFTLPAAQKG